MKTETSSKHKLSSRYYKLWQKIVQIIIDIFALPLCIYIHICIYSCIYYFLDFRFNFFSYICAYAVECVQSPAAFFANRLYKAMNGAGTNDAALIRLIVSRSEIDLGTIKDEFERIYDRTLFSAIVVSKLDETNSTPLYLSSFRRYSFRTQSG